MSDAGTVAVTERVTTNAASSLGGAGRVLLVGEFGIGNLGNEASLRAVVADLRAGTPGVELTCLCHVPDRVRAEHDIDALPLRAPVRPPEKGPVLKLVGRLFDAAWALRVVHNHDAVVIPGTGILEEVWVRPGGIPSVLAGVVLAASVARRPVALVSVGADVPKNRLTRAFCAFIVKRSAYVTARDAHSADALHNLVADRPRPPIRPDVAFGLPVPEFRAAGAPPVIAIGVMSYYGASDDPVEGAEIHERYLAQLQRLGDHLLATGRRIRILVGDSSDVDVARALEMRLGAGDEVEVRPCTSFDEVLGAVSDCEAVVATRFHNVVAAVLLRRPTVSVSYASKNDEVLRAVGLDGFSQPLEELDGERLIAQVEDVLRDGDRRVRAIDAAVHGLSRSTREQRGALRELVSRTSRTGADR